MLLHTDPPVRMAMILFSKMCATKLWEGSTRAKYFYSQIPSRIPSGRADTLVRAGRLRPGQVGQGADCGPGGPPYQRGSRPKFVIVFANRRTKADEETIRKSVVAMRSASPHEPPTVDIHLAST